MSLFSWFRSKPQTHRAHDAAKRAAPRAASARETTAAKAAPVEGSPASDSAEGRKNERARLREVLYNVVRESMVRVGVLSSSFKFKVLATDPRGHKFIVMMDLSRDFGGDISKLAEIETLICQAAKTRHNIVVSSVYWRAVAPSAQDEAEPHTEHTEAKHQAVNAPAAAPAREDTAPSSPKFEPVFADEVLALKRALSSGGAVKPATAAPTVSERSKNPAQLTGYESTEFIESELPQAESADTQILDDDLRLPALGPTQYGELR